METTIKISSLSDFNISLFTKLLTDVVSACGSVEITIKPKIEYNPEIIRRVKEVNTGEKLYSFSDEEFNKLISQFRNGETINKKNIKKVSINKK